MNFGSSNIDFVYSLNHIVLVGETLKSHQMNVFPGGKGLNQSIALARADARVHHAGCFGSDGEIINRLGYENEGFFRNIFKEKYGKTDKKTENYPISYAEGAAPRRCLYKKR